jgi:hypothetical protein
MSARHPMSEIPLFDEMHLEQTALALPKDIGCFRNIRRLANCMGERSVAPMKIFQPPLWYGSIFLNLQEFI